MRPLDKLFWVLARRFWSRWKEMLVLVQPETVARWHRAGFKAYWAMVCKARKRGGGGRGISKAIRELIFQMVAENPSWGAPRIHGELLMLGFEVSEITVSRWMRPAPRSPESAKRWLASLRNHREAIVAMDFFTVPTLTFTCGARTCVRSARVSICGCNDYVQQMCCANFQTAGGTDCNVRSRPCEFQA